MYKPLDKMIHKLQHDSVSHELTCTLLHLLRASSWPCLSSCRRTACTSCRFSLWFRPHSQNDQQAFLPASQSRLQLLSHSLAKCDQHLKHVAFIGNKGTSNVWIQCFQWLLKRLAFLFYGIIRMHCYQNSPNALETSPGQVHPPSYSETKTDPQIHDQSMICYSSLLTL